VNIDDLMRLCAEKYREWCPEELAGPKMCDYWVDDHGHPVRENIARAAFLWHWQTMIDADHEHWWINHEQDGRVWLRCWPEEENDKDYPDRASALCAYVEAKIGGTHE
jgi:hypothetical protein